MSLVIRQKTALRVNYLFFVLGLVVGTIERGNVPLLWVCIAGSFVALVVMLVRASRLEHKVSSELNQAQTIRDSAR